MLPVCCFRNIISSLAIRIPNMISNLLRYGIFDIITVYNMNTIQFKYRYVIHTGMLFQYVIDTGMLFRNNIPFFNSIQFNLIMIELRLS
jgi:hypothetical protein